MTTITVTTELFQALEEARKILCENATSVHDSRNTAYALMLVVEALYESERLRVMALNAGQDPDPNQSQIGGEVDEPESDDDEIGKFTDAECGRWVNGKLSDQCRLAGSEECDWECPIGWRGDR